MIPFEVFILGSSSATPTANRHPSAQVINFREKLILVDCGEGTQLQLRKYKIKLSKIETILISHLHGDHYFGLVGLLSSFHLLNRESDLHVYGPAGLQEIVELQFSYGRTNLCYKVHFHVLEPGTKLLYETDHLEVHQLSLKHSLPCWGFHFKEKPRQRVINREGLDEHNVPNHAINKIRNGQDYTSPEGKVIKNELLSFDPPAPRSYAYLTDTVVINKLKEQLEGVNLLYHEATFLTADKARAKQTMHSTALQAASFAKDIDAKELLLGHFSARYKSLNPFLDEARAVFLNTTLALEGLKTCIE